MISSGAVCILNTVVAGCGSSSESAAKTEEIQENAAGKWRVLEPDIVEKYEGNMITIKYPDDDMLYDFFTDNAQIVEGFSTENLILFYTGLQ